MAPAAAPAAVSHRRARAALTAALLTFGPLPEVGRTVGDLVGLPSLGARVLRAQSVDVAPMAVVLTPDGRSGALTLHNRGRDGVEVTVRAIYGYATTDAAGQSTWREVTAPAPDAPTAAPWLRFSPRFRLKPGEQRALRLVGSPPAELPAGEYWARLVVTTRRDTPVSLAALGDSAGQAALPAGVTVGLHLQIETQHAVFYRKGAVRTGLRLGAMQAAVVQAGRSRPGAPDTLAVALRAERTGNAAFEGTVRVTTVPIDTAGRPLGAPTLVHEQLQAVYYANAPRWRVALAGRLAPGRYRVSATYTAERSDFDPQQAPVLRTAPATTSAEVVVPPPGAPAAPAAGNARAGAAP